MYLAALSMGPSPVQEIAKKAGVSRVTTYDVIGSMTEQGLMSSVTKGKRQYYAAESPERLTSVVTARVDTMKGTLQELKSNLNALKMIEAGDKPVVKFVEGIEGIKALQEDILKVKFDTLYEVGNRDIIVEQVPSNVLAAWGKILDKNKVKTKAIYVSNKSFKPRKLSKIKYIRESKDTIDGDVIVYGSKITMSSFKGKVIGVSIDSADLAETVRKIIDRLWHCIP